MLLICPLESWEDESLLTLKLGTAINGQGWTMILSIPIEVVELGSPTPPLVQLGGTVSEHLSKLPSLLWVLSGLAYLVRENIPQLQYTAAP